MRARHRQLVSLLGATLLSAPGCILFVYQGPDGGDAGASQEVPLADGGKGYVLPDGGVSQSLVEPQCLVSPEQTTVGSIVTFDGQGSQGSPGAEVTLWAWSFGDGATGQGALVQHGFSDAGSFPATLTATDSSGATGTIACPPVTVSP